MSNEIRAVLLVLLISLAPTASRAEDPAAGGEEPPPAAGAAPAPAPKPGDEEMSIQRELKTVESEVDGLKEKVFRSKARLMLLEEKVVRGVVSGAKAVIKHKNNLGPAYALESITYFFDGNPVLQRTNAEGGTLSTEKDLPVFEGNIPPGNHTLSVTGVVRGRGSGLFAYLSDYVFKFSASYSFAAQDGRTTRLEALIFKSGGALADFVDGPAVEFKLAADGTGKGGKAKAEGSPAAGQAKP
jgi:hypothetical protein